MAKNNFKGSNVTIMVSSVAKSVKFYTEILGFKLKLQQGSHWAEVAIKTVTIGLHPKIKSQKVVRGDNMTIGLEVADIEKSMKELSVKGISFDFIKDSHVLLAYFNDPDNNVLYLFQYRKLKK